MRQYSQVGKPDKKPDSADAASDDSKGGDADYAEMKGPLSKLVASSRPDLRAILEQLSVKLGLGTAPTVESVKQKLKQVEDNIDAADSKLSAATRNRKNALKSVQEEIYDIWPELRAEYAPLAIELATDRADEFVSRVQKLPDYDELHVAKKKEDVLAKAALQLDREKARCERLLRACEDAVLAANLSRIAKPEIVKRYDQLLAMEEGTLADSSAANPQAQSTASAEK